MTTPTPDHILTLNEDTGWPSATCSCGLTFGPTSPSKLGESHLLAVLLERSERDVETVDIVFDGPPGPVPGRFIEVERLDGSSTSVGEWVHRDDGYWVLRLAIRRALTEDTPDTPSEQCDGSPPVCATCNGRKIVLHGPDDTRIARSSAPGDLCPDCTEDTNHA